MLLVGDKSSLARMHVSLTLFLSDESREYTRDELLCEHKC